jgi:hypothetical protein
VWVTFSLESRPQILCEGNQGTVSDGTTPDPLGFEVIHSNAFTMQYKEGPCSVVCLLVFLESWSQILCGGNQGTVSDGTTSDPVGYKGIHSNAFTMQYKEVPCSVVCLLGFF